MKNNNLLRVLGLLGGGVLLIVGFAMFHVPFVTAGSGNLRIVVSGYEFTFGDGAVAGITTAWVFALLLLIAGVCGIALFFIEKFDIVRIKILDDRRVRLGCACCVLLLSLTAGILLFCTLPLVGLSGTNAFSLGAGAILGGIFTLLGGCCLSCGIALPALRR